MVADQLRVLMVSPSARPGGAEEIFVNLVLHAADHGLVPRPAVLEPGPLVSRLEREGHRAVVIETGRLRRPASWRTAGRRIAAELAAFRAHVVYSNMPKAHLYCAGPARAARVPALWSQMMVPAPPHWTDRLASALPARRVIALSEAAAAAQRRLALTPPVDVMYPGVDVARLQAEVTGNLRARHVGLEDGPLIGIVGRLQPWKGQDRFLRAARMVADRLPAARFAVIGGAVLGWEGDYPARLRRLATELGLIDRVVFTGHVDDVARWTAALDIAVNASDPEPFGMVVIEAMALGTPVVAVDRAGPREILAHERTGMLCPSGDPEALAEAILALARDRNLRTRVVAAARAEVGRRFTAEQMTERFAAVVRASAAGGEPESSVPVA
jgi:glycosyltransferase involved in cell wall biosynthesis